MVRFYNCKDTKKEIIQRNNFSKMQIIQRNKFIVFEKIHRYNPFPAANRQVLKNILSKIERFFVPLQKHIFRA
jgi:hypothetical protein